VPWDAAPVGIFGEPRERQDVPADGDRIEIYRPLRSDPRQRRREKVRRDRRAKRR
jgi:putative ubiquitin-RnfH superfamily antitoxin RatB of RatAB toxin-antitoxin module